MANHFTYFDEYVTGTQPSDWTDRWVTTGHVWSVNVNADPPAIRGKWLEHTRTSSENRLLSWNAPGSPEDVEVLIRFRTTSWSSNQLWVVSRASGSGSNGSGYLFRNTAIGAVGITRMVGGALTNIGPTLSLSLSANEMYTIRFRVTTGAFNATTGLFDTEIKAKIWASDHETEPSSWTIERTDTSSSSINGGGWVGVGNLATTGTRTFDGVAVEDSGGTASFPVSPQTRTTQSATLALDYTISQARTTQAATLVLAADGQPIRTTQAATTILDYTISQVRQTQAAVLALTAGAPCLTKRAQVWKITRTDGVTFAFTTHDEPVKWMGLTYQPCDSLRSTASDSGIINSGSIGDTTVNGVLSDDSITEHDLANGLFDGAKVEVWLVPWNDSVYSIDQPQRLAAGVLGKTTQGGITYTAEMLSPGSKLVTRPLLEHYTPACRFELGDGRCPVDLDALRASSAVTAGVQRDAFHRRTLRQFIDTSLVQADGYFEFGRVVWLTGDNAGLRSEVKEQAAGVVTLWQAMPNDIKAGDTYTIEPGCDKSKDDHKNKFGLDMVSFGGFPDIPGQDVLTRTPNAKG